MAVELLVHAVGHRKAFKGTVQATRDVVDLDRYPWGTKEGLPNYVIIRITDATKRDVPQYLENIRNKFRFTLIQDKGTSRIYDITVDPKILALFGSDKGVTLEVLVVLNTKHPMTFVNRELDNSRLRVDVQNTDFAELFDDTLDQFEQVLDPRRFHLASADVDSALANGGRLETTLSQINTGIVDRLA